VNYYLANTEFYYHYLRKTQLPSLDEKMRYLLLPLLVLFAPLCWSEEDIAENKCPNNYAAKVVSLQGTLYFDPDGKHHWQPAQLNETLCEGSRVQVEANSRASLLLTNGITLRLDAGTVLSLNGLVPDKPTLLELFKGFVHFISRTPKRLQINTPIANAGPEGTEFAMSVDDNKASLWVYEGGVKFFNDKGSVHLSPGQGAQAQKGQAPQAHIDITPKDAVNWALYYPPILPYPDAATAIDSNIRTAIQDFRQGRINAALSRLDRLPPAQQTPYFHKVRGAILLSVGQDKLALQDINALLAHNPNDAEALALQSVIALTQNRKDEAYALANRAVSANPQSATAYSALSYAEQSRFQLDKAQSAANQATKLAPHDAMVWARKAELELAQGLTSQSQETAQRALGLDANLERTQTVTGFTYLLRMDTDEALQSFNKAIELDSSSPLARLGLGLAKIRDGDLAEGRQDLEIAAILDPNNSLIRSYLGKAYYEERRNPLAEDQFKLAKERDPKDPTPYFYDAIRKQTTNRPIEALHDMRKAIESNDNRAVTRSKLMLDQDSAARTANLARIYNDLGFGRVALKEAWKSLNTDSTNPTAHRFLSDAYIGQPRYRAARASELLQAQLLQPINITPVQPQLTGENIGILNSTGPGSLSLNEYDPLYNANGAHIVLNGAYGSNNTKTDNAIVSGVYNNLSGSLGQFHYQTDGFRKNDGFQQDIYDAFAQYAFTPDFSAQIEFKSDDVRAGDVPFRLNGFHRDNFKQTIEQDSARVGGHLRIDSRQNVTASYSYTTLKDITNYKLEREFFEIPFLDSSHIANNTTSHQAEMQYSYQSDLFNITAGGGYLNQAGHVKDKLTRTDEDGITEVLHDVNNNDNTDFYNGYVYLKNQILSGLTSVIGLSFDSFNNNLFERQQLSPKFGLIWNPVTNLTLRGAVFRTLKRPLVSNQTIEPTQIAGFNQFFDELNATSAWQYALGVDYNPVDNLYLGGEMTWRSGTEPINNNDEEQTVNFRKRDVYSHLAYFYWTPVDWLALKTEYRFDRFSRDFIAIQDAQTIPVQLTTQQVPLSVNFFHPSGLFAKLAGTYVDQLILEGDTDFGAKRDSESFWTFDAAIGYRFPKKFGVASLEVRNLFDNYFMFQSAFDASGPQITPFVPERQLFVKLSLFY
jgi:Flp pilus assembly protein TadD